MPPTTWSSFSSEIGSIVTSYAASILGVDLLVVIFHISGVDHAHLLVTHPKMRFVSSLHRDSDHIEVRDIVACRKRAKGRKEQPGPNRSLPFARPRSIQTAASGSNQGGSRRPFCAGPAALKPVVSRTRHDSSGAKTFRNCAPEPCSVLPRSVRPCSPSASPRQNRVHRHCAWSIPRSNW
jgi:hypothetical protein